MKYEKASYYDPQYVKELSMGPNPVKLLEELLALQPITAEDTVLDLGCGRGLTSMFLAREYDARVFAADLWISPGENKRRFDEAGLLDRIVPIRVEAHDLPFAEEYFDVVTCVDAYHYFGLDPDYLEKHLLPCLKHGGFLLIAVPGLKRDIHDDIPAEMLASWSPEDIETLHDADHWRKIISAAKGAEIVHMAPMEGCEECWDDWLACENEYAVNDRKAMDAGAGRYMNFISIILRRI